MMDPQRFKEQQLTATSDQTEVQEDFNERDKKPERQKCGLKSDLDMLAEVNLEDGQEQIPAERCGDFACMRICNQTRSILGQG